MFCIIFTVREDGLEREYSLYRDTREAAERTAAHIDRTGGWNVAVYAIDRDGRREKLPWPLLQ